MIRKVNRKRTGWLVMRVPDALSLGIEFTEQLLHPLLSLPAKPPQLHVWEETQSASFFLTMHHRGSLLPSISLTFFILTTSQLLSQIWVLASWFIPSEPLGPNHYILIFPNLLNLLQRELLHPPILNIYLNSDHK